MATQQASAVTEDKLLDDEFELEGADLEKQLEAEERKIIDADDDKVIDSKSDDSEKSDDEDDESQKLSAREERILELADARRKLEQAQAEIARLRDESESADTEADDEPEEFEVGEIDESFSELAPTLKANGTKLLQRIREAEKRSQTAVAKLLDRIDEMEAEQTRVALGIDKDEEDAIVEFAKNKNLTYSSIKELREIAQSYRDHKELEELRAEKAERENALKSRRKGETTKRSRPTSRKAADEELEELAAGGDPFNTSFDRAIKSTLSDLKAGRFAG